MTVRELIKELELWKDMEFLEVRVGWGTSHRPLETPTFDPDDEVLVLEAELYDARRGGE